MPRTRPTAFEESAHGGGDVERRVAGNPLQAAGNRVDCTIAELMNIASRLIVAVLASRSPSGSRRTLSPPFRGHFAGEVGFEETSVLVGEGVVAERFLTPGRRSSVEESGDSP